MVSIAASSLPVRHLGPHKEFRRLFARRVPPLSSFVLRVFLTVLLSACTLSPIRAGQTPNQAETRDKILHYVRGHFNIPETVKLTVSEFRTSVYPDFYQTVVTVGEGKDQRSQSFFISKDGRYLVEGNIYTLGGDPHKEIVRLISTEDQPTQGPANAPVTVVEYSDLECPTCARLHEMLETDIVPKYGSKVRVVFKEFPLAQIHDWALSAAVANECAYQIDPAKFVTFRGIIFKNQESLEASHIRDQLLHLAAEAGLDNLKLAACIDSQTSLPRVEASLQEGQALGVASTPTTFVNGRSVVGAPAPEDFYKLIDEALHDSK